MLNLLRNLDFIFLKAINSITGKSVYLDAVFIFLAVYFIFALALAQFLFFWRAKRMDWWILSAITVAAAYFTKPLIGFLHFRSRPFVMEGIKKLIDKTSAETSFPSGHTLIAFTLALSVFWMNKKWGALFLFAAAVVAVARIVVGVHYPSDILAGAFIAFAVSLLMRRKIYEKSR